MSWVYDGFGNRTAQNVVKGSVPVQSISVDMNTNRVTSWSYDANGNATSIPGVGTITCDASNRVKTVGGETYEYDPSNKRTWKNDTFTFWGGRGERVGTYSVTLMSDTTGSPTQWKLAFVKQTEDWYFGGRRLNQVQDRLGSERSGKSYYPYGEERTPTANPADKFATYHRDGTGLDYAQQRYYASGSGRFITSDPYQASGGTARPGSWNRYAYVSGDPVSNFDPGGLMELQPCPDGVGYVINGCGIAGGSGGGGDGMQDPGAGNGNPADPGGGGTGAGDPEPEPARSAEEVGLSNAASGLRRIANTDFTKKPDCMKLLASLGVEGGLGLSAKDMISRITSVASGAANNIFNGVGDGTIMDNVRFPGAAGGTIGDMFANDALVAYSQYNGNAIWIRAASWSSLLSPFTNVSGTVNSYGLGTLLHEVLHKDVFGFNPQDDPHSWFTSAMRRAGLGVHRTTGRSLVSDNLAQYCF